MEKARIPDSVQDLTLMEYQVQSKPWANILQFSVCPYTTALSIFIQDVTAGNSPRVPSSMFKVLDKSDIKLQKLQVLRQAHLGHQTFTMVQISFSKDIASVMKKLECLLKKVELRHIMTGYNAVRSITTHSCVVSRAVPIKFPLLQHSRT